MKIQSHSYLRSAKKRFELCYVTARLLLRILCAIFLFLNVAALSADEYHIQPISEDLAIAPGSDEAPVILKDGSVLYLLDHRLMKGDGELAETIYESDEKSDIAPYSVRSVCFNGTGDFVALCRAGSRQATLVLSEAGETTIVDRRPALALGPAAINDEGTVVYAVTAAEKLTQIIMYRNGEQQAIGQSRTLIGLKSHLPAINNVGQVAVLSVNGVFLIDISSKPPSANKLVSASPLYNFEGVVINDAGQVAFRAKQPRMGIYLAEGKELETIADTSGPYAALQLPALNDLGQIAFHATFDDGQESIVLVNDKKVTRVVSTGDPLHGSTITALRFSAQGLNDQGQIAFWAMLLDGTEGIYRASKAESE